MTNFSGHEHCDLDISRHDQNKKASSTRYAAFIAEGRRIERTPNLFLTKALLLAGILLRILAGLTCPVVTKYDKIV